MPLIVEQGNRNAWRVFGEKKVSAARSRVAGTSEVVIVPGDFPNDATTPDHRPVKATLTIVDPKQQILNRIAALEAELAALKVLVGQM